MLKYVIFAVIVVLAIVITWFVAIAYRKNIAEAKLGKAEDKAREIIDEALKRMTSIKKSRIVVQKFKELRREFSLKKRILSVRLMP